MSYQSGQSGVATPDPILFGSFGQSNFLDYLRDTGNNINWRTQVTVPPKETTAILSSLGVVNYFLPSAKTVAATKAAAILGTTTGFYNYVTPSGHRLLAHLNNQQLSKVQNWNFLNGGIGGDPHGVHFDGSVFELPNSPETYCLHSDPILQVNIKVGSYGFITEIVVFDRSRALVLNAKLENESPVYSLNSHRLSVPDTVENGMVSTRLAPFHFKDSPLNQLERYQESSVVLSNMVTIVGGTHATPYSNRKAGFFNVAIHQKPAEHEIEFPSLLQLPFHPLRDVGFSASVISDVWFDLLQ